MGKPCPSMGGICDCGHKCGCKCGCDALSSCKCGPGCKCGCACANKDAPMGPGRVASILRRIAADIDSAERPDRDRVWLQIRSLVAALEGRLPVRRRAAVQRPGIMAKKPLMDQRILELVLSHLDVDDTRVRELMPIEDLVAQAVFDATTTLAESLAELETEYGYGFDWSESAEEPPEPEEAPAMGEAPPPAPSSKEDDED